MPTQVATMVLLDQMEEMDQELVLVEMVQTGF